LSKSKFWFRGSAHDNHCTSLSFPTLFVLAHSRLFKRPDPRCVRLCRSLTPCLGISLQSSPAVCPPCPKALTSLHPPGAKELGPQIHTTVLQPPNLLKLLGHPALPGRLTFSHPPSMPHNNNSNKSTIRIRNKLSLQVPNIWPRRLATMVSN
jgi:hypothetical protein